jgi:hypothetical protein
MINFKYTLVLAGLFSTVTYAAPNLREELSNHKIAAELSSMMESVNQAEIKQREILTELPQRLAAEFLTPVVAGGVFAGKPGKLSYSSDLEYEALGDLTGTLDDLARSLGGVAGYGETVCVASEGSGLRKVVVQKEAAGTLHSALGTSSKALEPATHYLAKVGDTNLVISKPALGAKLFDMVEAAIERGGATRLRLVTKKGGQVDPNDKAAQLVLTTAAGQKLKLEVELDGARNGLVNSVPAGSEWRVNGSSTRVPFNANAVGQIAFLSVMLKEGSLVFQRPEKVVHFPSHFQEVKGAKFLIHVLGADNAWFSAKLVSAGGTMEVFRGNQGCDTSVVFSGDKQSVALGPLPDAAWSRASRFKAVRVDKYDPELGYLRGPHCSSAPSGISDRDFDEFLGRNDACKNVCGMTSQRIAKASSRVLDKEPYMSLLSGFRKQSCHSSCMSSRGYRVCVLNSLDEPTSSTFLYAASICDDRRP